MTFAALTVTTSALPLRICRSHEGINLAVAASIRLVSDVGFTVDLGEVTDCQQLTPGSSTRSPFTWIW